MLFGKIFKKVRPFLGIVIFVSLALICTAVVFFSIFSALILPLLWMIFTALHQMKKGNRKITYLWNATRFSMWVYFTSIFLFLVWTPDWIKTLSFWLERKSFLNVFSKGTYMYGRMSVAFICAAIVFIPFLIHYRWSVRKKVANN